MAKSTFLTGRFVNGQVLECLETGRVASTNCVSCYERLDLNSIYYFVDMDLVSWVDTRGFLVEA